MLGKLSGSFPRFSVETDPKPAFGNICFAPSFNKFSEMKFIDNTIFLGTVSLEVYIKFQAEYRGKTNNWKQII